MQTNYCMQKILAIIRVKIKVALIFKLGSINKNDHSKKIKMYITLHIYKITHHIKINSSTLKLK